MTDPALEPLRSVHTSNLPSIFNQLGISLVVSTYQAGKVVLVRADGESLNTHFIGFNRPMGIDGDGRRLTIGGANSVSFYRNQPAVSARIEPPGKHDAVYLPRELHLTGDIDIHEMAYAGDELWIVNTKFGCLCTLDAENSFVPRWKPPWLTALAPEDRCHLNGMALVDGQPRYVTALGMTDTPGGWRDNKRDGGLLMDVTTNEVLLRGLSMPHSPRLYQDRLWFLESGQGALSVADLGSGTWQSVAELPGFTRGLSFWGPLAFIGLSQVRESATFSGIPLVEKLKERIAGVWVVNWQSGETVGFLRFESGVREIFAVQVLPSRFPALLEWNDARLSTSYMLPDEAMSHVPAVLKGEAVAAPPIPDRVVTCVNEAEALLRQDRPDMALTLLDEAEQIAPEVPEIYNNRANALTAQNKLDEAIAAYEKGIGLRHAFPDAHMNLAMALLKRGDWERGWREWEWRWQTKQFTPYTPPRPMWQGQPLDKGALLVHTEQGAGDAIMLARFLPEAASRVEKLLLVAPDPLRPLLATIEGVDEVLTADETTPDKFDAYVAIMSLPHVLGLHDPRDGLSVPYLHAPEGHRLALPPRAAGKRRLGIVWAGSPTQGNDRNRSTTLETLAPLLAMRDIEWVSLQVGPRAGEAVTSPVPLLDVSDQLNDWRDTAALLADLDGVVGVDTGVIHLAGAMGLPVWTLLCYAPDWRWGIAGDESAWYPTMRLIRQPAPGEWGSVVAAVREEVGASN